MPDDDEITSKIVAKVPIDNYFTARRRLSISVFVYQYSAGLPIWIWIPLIQFEDCILYILNDTKKTISSSSDLFIWCY